MFDSKNNYTLTIPKSIAEAREILLINTLDRTTLMMENTDKLFIGKIQGSGFFVMGSSKIGLFCTLNGKFESKEGSTIIEIETKLQKAFFRLLIFAVLAIAVPVFMPYIIGQNLNFSIAPFIQWFFMALLFYYLFRAAYIVSRNQGIKQLEKLLY
jgi:hypothetical protein